MKPTAEAGGARARTRQAAAALASRRHTSTAAPLDAHTDGREIDLAHQRRDEVAEQVQVRVGHLAQRDPGLAHPVHVGEPGEQHAHKQQQQVQLDEGGDGRRDQRQRGRGGAHRREQRHRRVAQPARATQSERLSEAAGNTRRDARSALHALLHGSAVGRRAGARGRHSRAGAAECKAKGGDTARNARLRQRGGGQRSGRVAHSSRGGMTAGARAAPRSAPSRGRRTTAQSPQLQQRRGAAQPPGEPGPATALRCGCAAARPALSRTAGAELRVRARQKARARTPATLPHRTGRRAGRRAAAARQPA